VGGIGCGPIKDAISCWAGLRKSRNPPHDSRYLGLDSKREPPKCKSEPACLVTTLHDTAIRCVSVSVKPFVSVISDAAGKLIIRMYATRLWLRL
jgi:hypothetical protein